MIDPNPENREVAQELGIAYIESEAADDEVLRAAGIDRARAVIACVDSDAENIFIALTARELRSDIRIVARAAVEESEKKLLRAGADRVISPYKTSGAEMARMALHPQVGAVLDFEDLRMEEIVVTPPCAGEGQDDRGGARGVGDRRAAAPGRSARGAARAADGDRPRRHAGRARRSGGAGAARGHLPAGRGGDGGERARRRARRAGARGGRRPFAVGEGETVDQIRLERSRREGQGDYSTNAAMLLAPALKEPPRAVAERIGEELSASLGDDLERAEVAGPGFLNLFLSDDWHRRALGSVLAAG